MKQIIMAAIAAEKQKNGYTPHIEEQDRRYIRLAYTHLGTGYFANRALIEVKSLFDGRFSVSAGYRTEDIDQQDGAMEFGDIEGFFANSPFANDTLDRMAYQVTVEQEQLQSLLEWAFDACWLVQTECDDCCGIHVCRAWLS